MDFARRGAKSGLILRGGSRPPGFSHMGQQNKSVRICKFLRGYLEIKLSNSSALFVIPAKQAV